MYKFDEQNLLKSRITHIQETLKRIERYRKWALPPQPVNIKGATSHYKTTNNNNASFKLKREDLKVVRNKVLLNKILTYCNNIKQWAIHRHHNASKSKHVNNNNYQTIRKIHPIKPVVIHQRSLMKTKAILMKNRSTSASSQNSKNLKEKINICEKNHTIKKENIKKDDKTLVKSESFTVNLNFGNEKTKFYVNSVDSDKTLTGNNNISAITLNQALKSNTSHSSDNKKTLNSAVKKKNEMKKQWKNKSIEKSDITNNRARGGAEIKESINNLPEDEPSAIKIQPTFKIPRLKTDYSSIMDCYRVRSKYPIKPHNVEEMNIKPVSDVIKNMLTLRTSQLRINQIENVSHNRRTSMSYTPHSYENRKRLSYYAGDIRLAVLSGGTRDPSTNEILNRVLAKALNDNVSWSFIDQILTNCKRPKQGNTRIEVLQIELHSNIFLICTVYTNDMPELVAVLESVMTRFNARFAPVINHFTHCCVIEAIAPFRGESVRELKNYLKKVSKSMGLNSIDIINYDTLEVSLKSKPEDMGKVADLLTRKGYKILDLDFGFRPKELISLTDPVLQRYHRFITYLQETTNFETITDNVM